MPGKGSKYREFYDLSGRITCMLSTCVFIMGSVETFDVIIYPVSLLFNSHTWFLFHPQRFCVTTLIFILMSARSF